MGGQVDVQAVAQLALLARLGEVPSQPAGEPVELGVLHRAQLRVAQGPAPEADLDLGLEVALVVERQRLEHDHAQRAEPGQAGRTGLHPGRDPAVRQHERRAEDVGLVVEVVREYARRAVRLAGDGPDGGLGDAVARDHPPGGGQDLVAPLIPVDDLRHVPQTPITGSRRTLFFYRTSV